MIPDGELLGRYEMARDEEAFAEVVRRHLGAVYGTALRMTSGDAHLAEEVSVGVFADLAKKAELLRTRAVLSGWLHTSVRFAVAKAVRGEHRRRRREALAHVMSSSEASVEPAWEQLRPVLDEAIGELSEPDRDAVALRYFEQHSFGQMAERLAISENAARMRTERALDRLRERLARRRITSTAAALGLVLGTQLATAAPVGMARRVAGRAMGSADGAEGAVDAGRVGIGGWGELGWLSLAAAVFVGGWLVSDAGAGLSGTRNANRHPAVGESEQGRRTVGALEPASDREIRSGRTTEKGPSRSDATRNSRTRVEAPKPTTIVGEVRYRESGEKVPRFTVLPGRLEAGTNGVPAGNWEGAELGALPFFDGSFRWEVKPNENGRYSETTGTVLKVDVKGCAPEVVGPVRMVGGESRVTVWMRRGNEQQITVLLPDGNPAVDAEIGVATPENQLVLQRGEFRKNRGVPVLLEPFIRTANEEGRFTLIPEETTEHLVVAHPGGYAVVTADQARRDRVIRLGLGNLEGQWMSAGKPVSRRTVRARLDTDARGGGLWVNEAFFSAPTDAEGRFSLKDLPPGRWHVFGLSSGAEPIVVRPWTAWTDAMVRAGETTEVALGGAEVRFQMRLPEGLASFSPSNVWAILGSRTVFESSAEYERWVALQRRGNLVAKPAGAAISFVGLADSDGIWITEGGNPGNQELRVQIHDPRTHAVLAEAVRSVVLSEMQTRGVVDLGVIELRAVEKPPVEIPAE